MDGSSDELRRAVLAACLLEATARKPGNVHPLAAFADCDWRLFCESASAIAPVLARAPESGLGAVVFDAVEVTLRKVGRNTNLGMILLLAPLAQPRELTSSGVEAVLGQATMDDCRLVYQAIRLANPGGLGHAEAGDVREEPAVGLVEAMRLVADRDSVARQYVNGFSDVFRLSQQFTGNDLASLEQSIVKVYLEQLAREPDSLIARKCGIVIAEEVSRRARGILAERRAKLGEFDQWLRADGNRRNPGTTADLIAASLFVAIRNQWIPCFDAEEILAYGERIRRSGSRVSECRW